MTTTHNLPLATPRGVTLVETVLSLLILGGAFVAALNTIASARGSQATITQRQMGLVLAEDLMAEILAQATYKEGITFGPELGERDGKRSSFDDLDDYNGWSASPPQDTDGNAIPGADAYTREAEVVYVELWNPANTTLINQGMARVTVTVKRAGKTVAQLVAYRSDAWRSPAEEQG